MTDVNLEGDAVVGGVANPRRKRNSMHIDLFARVWNSWQATWRSLLLSDHVVQPLLSYSTPSTSTITLGNARGPVVNSWRSVPHLRTRSVLRVFRGGCRAEIAGSDPCPKKRRPRSR